MTTLDNTQAHCAQLHTNDKNRAWAYADRMQSLGYRVTTSSDYSPANRGAIYTVTAARTRAEGLAALEDYRSSGNSGATD